MSRASKLSYPAFLSQGDKIALLTPASKIEQSQILKTKELLCSWGYEVVIGKHANAAYGCFSGTVKQRKADFQKALDDPTVKAILCSRGGYGAVHLVDQLNFEQFKKAPKWLIGFSDITLLHQLFQSKGYVSLHAPMSYHLANHTEDAATLLLKSTLVGKLPSYTISAHPYNRLGLSEGVLCGGNLSVMYGMRATPYDIDPNQSILFIEDVGEKPYHIDRMMNNLRLSGVLGKINGLIVGQFTEYEEDKSLGSTVYQLIRNYVSNYNYPVCFNFPVGHVDKNYPLIMGSKIKLEITSERVKFRTLPPTLE